LVDKLKIFYSQAIPQILKFSSLKNIKYKIKSFIQFVSELRF